MSQTDIRYIEMLGLDKLRWSDSNTMNFRCPICHGSKPTAYLLGVNSDYPVFHCFRRLCHETLPKKTLYWLIKHINPGLAASYLKDKVVTKEAQKTIVSTTQVVKNKTLDAFRHKCNSLDKVTDENEVLNYMLKRQIPIEHYDKLFYYYGSPWMLYETVVDNKFRDRKQFYGTADWHGVIVPFVNRDKSIIGFTMRTLNKEMRYITLTNDYSKGKYFFGEDEIDTSQRLFIFEGIFDRLTFADSSNKLAMMSTNTKLEYLDEIYGSKNVTFCFDNEYSNEAIQRNILKIIKEKYSVFIWDSTYHRAKDINDLKVMYNLSDGDIMTYISDRTFSGYHARAELNKRIITSTMYRGRKNVT